MTDLSTTTLLFIALRMASPIQGGTMQMPMAQHQAHGPAMPAGPLGIDAARDGAGTSWLPDTSPMHALMRTRGAWSFMVHGNAFVHYIRTGSDRGDDQFGSTNWLMTTAQRDVRGGLLQLRAMLSAEAATVGRCGYPSLLQTGEQCRGEVLHDRQHPHDVFMELAASYRRALGQSVAFEVYGGPVGDPALGPTSFAHRSSAMPNPVGPISHHWLDSSHISFGVFTAGVYGRRWKAEASAFNGREPDDKRWTIDLAAMDSYSGRLSLMITPGLMAQVSAGHLADAEANADGTRADVDRITASITYHRLMGGRLWATTAAWGQNREPDHATNAFTVESAADVTVRDVVFARADVTGKPAGDLVLPGVPPDDTMTVAKFQIGYTRWLMNAHGVQAGLGASAGIALIPDVARPAYGGRTAGEFAVFFNIRPSHAR